MYYDCKGNGSYQTANKSQGNKRYNSSGRNSHTKDHCAVSLSTKCPVNNTITKGTAGEAVNVDSAALSKLGKICLIMDRGIPFNRAFNVSSILWSLFYCERTNKL